MASRDRHDGRRDLAQRAEIAQRMRSARGHAGMSLKEAADAFGLSPNAISAWENGGSFPWVENLVQAANVYDVSLDWLLGRRDERDDPDEAFVVQAFRAGSEVDRAALRGVAQAIVSKGERAA